MSQPDPFSFFNDAIKAAHAKNELLAANARIKQLEERLEALREAGDDIWYCVRHAQTVNPQELIEAIAHWQEARNDG
jgi:hypothetical protein